jgi:molybdopterin converting factor small subunit
MREEDTQIESQFSTSPLSGFASIKIMGNLARSPTGKRVEGETFKAPLELGSLLQDLRDKYSLELRRDGTLVMINGVEARALQDLETIVLPGDEVVLVPMFHGG